MLLNHTIKGGAVTPYSCIEVTETDDLVCVEKMGDDRVDDFIKFIFDLVLADYCGSIGVKKGCKHLPLCNGAG